MAMSILLALFFAAAFNVYIRASTVVATADRFHAKKAQAVSCGNTNSTVADGLIYTEHMNGSFYKRDIKPMGRKGNHEAMNDSRPEKHTSGTGCSHLPSVASLLCGITPFKRRIFKVRTRLQKPCL